ncbi:MAG TPA: EAL domain-containing protein [Thiobacillaceae bacterium]|nr:EAL domain-containing protein [Thiobacillaceae bacterium]
MLGLAKALALLLLLAAAAPATAADTLTLGMFAYRPKAILEKRYRPLADYLSRQLPDTRVELRVLSHPEMERAMALGQVDLVFTSPSHYILLRSRNKLTGALATLVSMENGQATSSLGGVIIGRSDLPGITRLTDLKGRRIAVPGTSFLGGYQAQAYELLQAGLELPADVQLNVVKGHDQVVEAVLDGQAEYGFVRTGIIEELTRDGLLDPARLRIIHRQYPPGYPFRVSTRLYPEWAFVALPHVNGRITRKVAAGLMALDEEHPVARAAGIGGFAPPGDYLPVENLVRALRLPPFDKVPPFTPREVWQRWQLLWIILITGIGTTLLLTVIRLSNRNRALERLEREHEQSAAATRESEQHFHTLADSGSALIWTSGPDKRCDYFNEPWLRFTGRTLEQELGDGWAEGAHPEDLDRCLATYSEAFDRREPFTMDYRLRHADGGYRWIRDEGRPRYDSAGRFIGYIGHCYDITDRKQADAQLQLAASVFTSAREGIIITDPAGVIVDANAAFTDITGYTLDEAVGRNTSFLKSGRQGPEFYAELWRSLLENGHWSGEIWNRRKDGEPFAESITISAVRDTAGRLRHYVALFSDITAQKEQQQQLEHSAHFDSLTGLPNRVLLADRLHQAMAQTKRRGLKLVVALIDLDGFKEVNDRHGHRVGDDVLMNVAERMRSALRESDTIARMGGDEFVAVLVDLNHERDCVPMIQRLLEATAQPVRTDDQVVQVSGSIGYTFYPQSDEIEAEQLLRQADQAMYQAKLAGKNRYLGFDAELARNMRSQHETLEDIKRGLVRQEFLLHYQPKVNMRSGEVVGAEALLRWSHPERGLLTPAAFLPSIVAHQIDIEIGQWVIDTALTQIEAWQAQGLWLPVSVNISALHLQQPDFVDRLHTLLNNHPLVQRGSLELEVVETSALEDIRHVSQIIRACADMGVGFALDDFGTGYSSLTYLKHLPVDVLKIDQSFVRDMLHDPEDLAILQGVQGLAQAFQLRVIAEGVETVPHGEMLLQLGCELAQGYGIARPMPPEALPDWVKQWRPAPSWVSVRSLSHSALSILYAGVEHRAWLRGFEKYLNGERGAPPAMDGRLCRFGQWLETARTRTGSPAGAQLAKIDTLHTQLHDLVHGLLEGYLHGDATGARAGLLDARAISDRLLEEMRGLYDNA